ncbi:MAG: PQQ-dependent sugar dehydrogenase [Segetibacter sp.]
MSIFIIRLPSAANNRISRFTANGDIVVPGSEVVVLNLDPLSSATNHNGGSIHFGKDGKLYVAVGENANSANAQNPDTYLGKILRINSDGSVPTGNPFTTGSEQRKRVWEYGLRNPFTFDIQPVTGRIFVNDVGQNTWEEVNDCTSGGHNYGWPNAEGMSSNSLYTNPVYTYKHWQRRRFRLCN